MQGGEEEEEEEEEDLSGSSMLINSIIDSGMDMTSFITQYQSFFLLSELFTDVLSIASDLDCFGYKLKLIGSAGEGLMYFAMDNGTTCDVDTMLILTKCEAYEHSEVLAPQGHWQFQMEPCDRNPAYVRPKVIKEGSALTMPISTSIRSFFEHDSSSNVYYLSNAIPATLHNFGGNFSFAPRFMQSLQMGDVMTGQVVTGPSLSRVTQKEFTPGVFAIDKFDQVISIPCPTWPSVASEWIVRKRLYGWPSQEFISEHVKRGCYIVPVGCKECDRRHLDWRLSFVLVEQALIRGFNRTQFRCLLLLKQLKTFFFQGQISDMISSYVLKTIVFWVIEESPHELWVPDQLLKTVQICLDRLISVIQKDFCPNYFIRTSNLLAKRYTRKEKQVVLGACDLARRNVRDVLCQTPPFNNSSSSQRMVEHVAQNEDEEIPNMTEMIFRLFLGLFNEHMCMIIRLSLSCQQTLTNASRYCKKTHQQLAELFSKHNIPQQDTIHVRKQIDLMFRRFVWTNIYLMSTSNKSRYRCIRMLRKEFTEMTELIEAVTNCHLNTVVEDFTTTNEKLKVLISKYRYLPYERMNVPIAPLFNGNNLTSFFPFVLKFAEIILKETESNARIVHFSSDIMFLRFEKKLIPLPIQMEMSSNQSNDGQFDVSSGMSNTVAVDPLVYACFLRFWCCVKLEKNIEMLKARDDMMWCCSLPSITNKAVAFNLLGYCHKHLEEYDAAFEAFCTAWKQDPRSDATLVHIFVLVHSTIRRELNETCPD